MADEPLQPDPDEELPPDASGDAGAEDAAPPPDDAAPVDGGDAAADDGGLPEGAEDILAGLGIDPSEIEGLTEEADEIIAKGEARNAAKNELAEQASDDDLPQEALDVLADLGMLDDDDVAGGDAADVPAAVGDGGGGDDGGGGSLDADAADILSQLTAALAEDAGDSVDEAAEAVSQAAAPAAPAGDFGTVDLPDFGSTMSQAKEPAGMSLLNDVELRVQVELGRTCMYVEDVLRLTPESVIELDKAAGDPVDIYVNQRHVARGEVLVLNENFCVRISEIVRDVGGDD